MTYHRQPANANTILWGFITGNKISFVEVIKPVDNGKNYLHCITLRDVRAKKNEDGILSAAVGARKTHIESNLIYRERTPKLEWNCNRSLFYRRCQASNLTALRPYVLKTVIVIIEITSNVGHILTSEQDVAPVSIFIKLTCHYTADAAKARANIQRIRPLWMTLMGMRQKWALRDPNKIFHKIASSRNYRTATAYTTSWGG